MLSKPSSPSGSVTMFSFCTVTGSRRFVPTDSIVSHVFMVIQMSNAA